MMKLPFLLLLIFSGSLSAQRLSHPVTASRDDASLTSRVSVPDTLDVLTVMVQFQPDDDARTSGDGTFDLSTGTPSIIDPPPHDKLYVEDHLAFLRNYYRRSSKGRMVIRTTVADSVFTLPSVMAAYSPPRGGSDSVVANLVRDSWLAVNTSGIVPNLTSFDCFVVVHAGVGRDVDLASELGYDPTPFDIPSLYFGLHAFRKFYGEGYQGIPVNGGFITNTILLPETESRAIPTISGDVLLELGINGLLCASVGSHLGLPDLFDTNTGSSGIGRFGLMDGQSIFSFSGLFPPEPSAWEKYALGWIDPITVSPGQTAIDVPAVGFADSSTRVYRIPIGAKEYFLVENRNRDPLQNGQTITVRANGTVQQIFFRRDTTGFNAFDISGIAGNVMDVEDLDWSLPGGVESDGTFYDGGILIWHIDEHIIEANLSTNTVNADPDRRGVGLMEADGSQDIGRQFDFLSPGSGSEDGTPLDFWFLGNPSPVNTNEFSPTSFPDSKSTSGANSHITINNFSARGPVMQATVHLGDNSVILLYGFPKQTGEILSGHALAAYDGAQFLREPVFVVATTGITLSGAPGSGKLFAWRIDGTAALPGGRSDGLIAAASSSFGSGPSIADADPDGIADIVVTQVSPSGGSMLTRFSLQDTNGDSLADPVFSIPFAGALQSAPVLGDSSICFGSTNGKAYRTTTAGSVLDSLLLPSGSGDAVTGVSTVTGAYILAGSDGAIALRSSGGSGPANNVASTIAGPAVAGYFGTSEVRIVFATTNGQIYATDASLNTLAGFPVNTGLTITEPPALGDIDGDGMRDIVVFGENTIVAINSSGAMLDNFPVALIGHQFSSSPVLADLNNDGLVDAIGGTSDGLVVAYDSHGKPVSGFPLQAGTGDLSLAVATAIGPQGQARTILAAASTGDGSLSAWQIGETSGTQTLIAWSQFQHDGRHSGLDLRPLSGQPSVTEFFPPSRTYNWPNPVYDGRTFIRYYVRDNATVAISIFDLAGDLVATLSGQGTGGMDNEIAWNTSGVQSGIYFARIEATGTGASGVAVIKVAIVK